MVRLRLEVPKPSIDTNWRLFTNVNLASSLTSIGHDALSMTLIWRQLAPDKILAIVNFLKIFFKRQKSSKNVKGVKKHHIWRVKSIDVNEDAKMTIYVIMTFLNWRQFISIDLKRHSKIDVYFRMTLPILYFWKIYWSPEEK